MALTDPLGDMLTRIRNGQRARKDSVLTPASKLRARVLDVLQRERALGALHGELAILDGRSHARRNGDRFFTDAAHQNTSASTSPPTFCSRASLSESTPRGVETMVMPKPLRTTGSSLEPE